jgi:hypothetical protein
VGTFPPKIKESIILLSLGKKPYNFTRESFFCQAICMRIFGENSFPKNLFRANYFGMLIIAWNGIFCTISSARNKKILKSESSSKKETNLTVTIRNASSASIPSDAGLTV